MRSLVSALRGARSGETKTPVPYASRYQAAGYGGMLPAGSEAQMKAMGSNSTLFAIVQKYGSATAATDWHLYRKPTPGRQKTGDRAEVFSHAALDLWNTPNPFYTQPRFVKTVQQHRDLIGEGVVVVVRLGSIPVEIWPVRPDRMEPVPDHEKYLAGWVYHGPDGQRVPLEAGDVVQMQQAPCPWDPYHGMGAVQTLLTDLYSARAAAEWNRAFFSNSAEPGGVVEIDRRLSRGEFDELRDRWREQHQGVNNAHRVAILEQVKWKQNAFSPRDMQFVELRAASSQMIREAFAFPKTMLGDIEDVNRASAEAETYIFASGHTVPRLDDWRDEFLNARLLPMYGSTGRAVEFDYDSPVPEDREAADRERTSTATAVSTLVTAGFDAAAVLEWAGLPDMAHKSPPTPAAAPPGRAPAPGMPTPPKALAWGRTASHRRSVRLHFGDEADSDDEPDLAGVLGDLVEALAELETDYAETLAKQVDSLVEQVEAAVDDGVSDTLAGLAAVAVPAALLGAEVARTALDRIAAKAARRAAGEAAAEGVEVDQDDLDQTVEEETAESADVATVVVTLAAAGLAASAAREALRVWSPGATGKQVGAKVRTYLEGLEGSDRKTSFGAMLHRGTNLGRAAAFIEALKVKVGGKIFAFEKNDPNRCQPCKKWHGHQFATLAEAREMYDTGGYPLCLGRERCRGTYYVTWRSRSPAPTALLVAHNRPGDHPMNPARGNAALARAPIGTRRDDAAEALDADERLTIAQYQGAAYVNLNETLRRFGGDLPESFREILPYHDWAETLDGVMGRSKLKGAVEVHRGVKDGQAVFGDAWGGDLTGAEWVEHGYTSASADEKVADLFTEGGPAPAKLRIRVARGVGGIELSGAEYESELMLERGLTMQVVGDTGPGPGRVVDIVVKRKAA